MPRAFPKILIERIPTKAQKDDNIQVVKQKSFKRIIKTFLKKHKGKINIDLEI